MASIMRILESSSSSDSEEGIVMRGRGVAARTQAGYILLTVGFLMVLLAWIGNMGFFDMGGQLPTNTNAPRQSSFREGEDVAENIDAGGVEQYDIEPGSLAQEGHIGLLMWNPHGECFMPRATHCTESFKIFADGLLLHATGDFRTLDFATLAYTSGKFAPPSGWAAFTHTCHGKHIDDIMLLYRTSAWMPVPGANRSACMEKEGSDFTRPFYVQGFTSKPSSISNNDTSGQRMSVIVVSAHFPHRAGMQKGLKMLSEAVRGLKASTGIDKVITMADTNLGNSNGGHNEHRRRIAMPGPKIMHQCCGVSEDEEGAVQSSDIAFTCCDHALAIDGYDRIMANFGTRMQTVLPLKASPDWSAQNFHIPVIGYLYDSLYTEPLASAYQQVAVTSTDLTGASEDISGTKTSAEFKIDARPPSGHIGLLMWNPHGECFMPRATHCTESFKTFADRLLLHKDNDYKTLDFATLAYTSGRFVPPTGWAAFTHTCHGKHIDDIMMLYRTSAWMPVPGANRSACMEKEGSDFTRPFYVQGFTSKSLSNAKSDTGRQRMSIVVVSAHFPHRAGMQKGLKMLSEAVRELKATTGIDKVITMADTNLGNSNGGHNEHRRRIAMPGPKIMHQCCGVSEDEEGAVQSSDIAFTCCDHALAIDGYDRIMANFGTRMQTVLPLKASPDWSMQNFHIPVIGYLYDSLETEPLALAYHQAAFKNTTSMDASEAISKTATGVELEAGAQPHSGYIGLLMWNPHGECFMPHATHCTESFKTFANGLLLHTDSDYKTLDFATLAYTSGKFEPPTGWAAYTHTCHGKHIDDIMMLYRTSAWTPVPGANRSACMEKEGSDFTRPFYVQGFTSNSSSVANRSAGGQRMSIVVVSAHFPHRAGMQKGLKMLSKAVRELKIALGTENVITMADTNLGNSNGGHNEHRRRIAMPGPKIMHQCCGVSEDEEVAVQSSDIAFTCCDHALAIDGYDRIMANFGTRMQTVLPLPASPDWSMQNFHIPVIGYLYNRVVEPEGHSGRNDLVM